MPRMRILSISEQEAFDKPSLFDHEQRKQFFSFPNALLNIARGLRTPNSQIGFLLLCGYFKASKCFFLPQDFLQRDIEAVSRQLGLDGAVFDPNDYTETTRLRQQKIILEFYGFRPFDSEAEKWLGIEITTMAGVYLKPKLIFDRCVDFLVQKRVQVPKSWVLTELIRVGLSQRKTQNQQLKTVIGELDASVFGLIREIRHLTDNGALSDTQKVDQIRTLLDQGKMESFEQLKDGLTQAGQAQDWYGILEKQSLRLQNRLTPILKALTFEPITPADKLAEAIKHFKTQDGIITDKAPTDFLEAEESAALVREDGTFRPSLYKVFLFQHVAEAVKSGHLNLPQSYKYRPMDSYLIDRERWQRDKQMLLERAGLTGFIDPEPVLKILDTALLRQYQDTNAAIGNNPHLHFRADGSFYVHTPALDANETGTLQELFPQRHDVPLAQVLDTIDQHCGMLNAFGHWQQTHTPQTVSRPVLLAGIMGLGCGIGVRKMARISSRLTENELEHVVNWRFSLENIRSANDRVLKAMDAMELPNRYRREAGRLHTASDGQKFEVRGESLHASRSFKYFGQGQGPMCQPTCRTNFSSS